MARPRFHLAFPVHDLGAARAFYVGVLGCTEGRSAPEWVDFDLHGHQLAAHLRAVAEGAVAEEAVATHDVDGHEIPIRHFGLILPWNEWELLAERLRSRGVPFEIEPYVRFAGRAGEQGTMFVRDPSGNALEFKTFRDDASIFARDEPPG